MKSSAQGVETELPAAERKNNGKGNGRPKVVGESAAADLAVILAGLQTMRGEISQSAFQFRGLDLQAKSPIPSTKSSLPISRWRKN